MTRIPWSYVGDSSPTEEEMQIGDVWLDTSGNHIIVKRCTSLNPTVWTKASATSLAELDSEADSKLATVETDLVDLKGIVSPKDLIEEYYQVSNILDDTLIRMEPPVFTTGGFLQCGSTAIDIWGYGASMRFIVNVPQGAIIKRACLILTAQGHSMPDNPTIIRSELGVEDTINATRINSREDFLSRPRIITNWDEIGEWVRYTEYASPSLIKPIQHLISNLLWKPGNAIQILWDDRLNRSDEPVIIESGNYRQAYRSAYPCQQSAPVEEQAPKLYIGYVIP